jgi:DnaJ-class molecular chaperone
MVIENESIFEPGDYVIRVERCRSCGGQGGICFQWHKQTCERCDGTGRIGMVQEWPGDRAS